MIREAEQPRRSIQVACDRCTQGVMDATNHHLHGRCRCPCHGPPLVEAVAGQVAFVRPSVCWCGYPKPPADLACCKPHEVCAPKPPAQPSPYSDRSTP